MLKRSRNIIRTSLKDPFSICENVVRTYDTVTVTVDRLFLFVIFFVIFVSYQVTAGASTALFFDFHHAPDALEQPLGHSFLMKQRTALHEMLGYSLGLATNWCLLALCVRPHRQETQEQDIQYRSPMHRAMNCTRPISESSGMSFR